MFLGRDSMGASPLSTSCHVRGVCQLRSSIAIGEFGRERPIAVGPGVVPRVCTTTCCAGVSTTQRDVRRLPRLPSFRPDPAVGPSRTASSGAADTASLSSRLRLGGANCSHSSGDVTRYAPGTACELLMFRSRAPWLPSFQHSLRCAGAWGMRFEAARQILNHIYLRSDRAERRSHRLRHAHEQPLAITNTCRLQYHGVLPLLLRKRRRVSAISIPCASSPLCARIGRA